MKVIKEKLHLTSSYPLINAKQKKILDDICKECGKEHHIPTKFCGDCYHVMRKEFFNV